MTERPTYPWSACAVPFCRRRSRRFRPGEEWLCGEHWRLVDRALKTFWRKRLQTLYLRWAKAKAIHDATPTRDAWMAERSTARRWHRTRDLLWRRMKRQAVERSAGL